jgi:hypothetical protein
MPGREGRKIFTWMVQWLRDPARSAMCAACGSEITGDAAVIGDKLYHPSDLACIKATKAEATQLRKLVELRDGLIAELREENEALRAQLEWRTGLPDKTGWYQVHDGEWYHHMLFTDGAWYIPDNAPPPMLYRVIPDLPQEAA